MSRNKVELSTRPDGFGFFYGSVRSGDRTCHINVLPPRPLWTGDFVLDGHEPHATDWIIYADGEEIARVRRREDIAAEVGRKLLGRSTGGDGAD